MAMQAHTAVIIEFPVSHAAERRISRERYGRSGLRGLRLTRRGRFVVWVMAIVVSVVAGAMLGGVAAAGEAPEGIAVTVHAVEQGDTLWALASTVNPGKDNRDVIFEIMRLNGMSDASLRAGQTLLLPTYEDYATR